MKQVLPVFVFVLIGLFSTAQSKQNNGVTVQDALDFLNAKFKANRGIQELTDTNFMAEEKTVSLQVTNYHLDTLYLKSDSILVVKSGSEHGSIGGTNSKFASTTYTYYINLNRVSLVQYKSIEDKKPKFHFGVFLTYCSESYYITAKTDSAIMFDFHMVPDAGQENGYDKYNCVGHSFDYANFLTNKGVNPIDFNEFAKRIGAAFNFLINAPVRPHIEAPKEKF